MGANDQDQGTRTQAEAATARVVRPADLVLQWKRSSFSGNKNMLRDELGV